MPRLRVELEETGPDRFIAEVEIGGASQARRVAVRGTSQGEILARVAEAMGCEDELVKCLGGTPAVRSEDPPLGDEGGTSEDDETEE